MEFKQSRVNFTAHNVKIAGILNVPAVEGKFSAIVCTHPTSSCKDQTAGRYAEQLAQKGFVTLAFDSSFQGESGGEPRFLEIPEYRIDDIRSAVDFLTTLDFVDENKIGALGICAGGGYTINAAMTDKRIKAVGTVVGVNLGRIYREMNAEATLKQISAQRNLEANGGEPLITNWIPKSPQEARELGITDIDVLEAVDYYTTPRGQHKNSPNKVNLLSFASIIGFDAFRFSEKLLTQPLQVIIGEKAGGFGSYRDGFEIFNRAASVKKDLMVIKGTSHYELYDKPEPMRQAVEKLTTFYKENLC